MDALTLFLLPTLLAGALLLHPQLKTPSTFLTTLNHELGHGLTVLPTFPIGGRMLTIRIEADGQGEGQVIYPRFIGSLVRFISLMMGYATPFYVGFTLFLLTINGGLGFTAPILATTAFIGLLFVRGVFGWLSSLALLIISIVIINNPDPNLTTAVVIFYAATLIIGGSLDLIQVAGGVFRFGQPMTETDFDIASQEALWGLVSPQGWFVLFVALHTTISVVVFTPLLTAITP